MSNPPVKNTGERGREVWRRKGIPESSNQGGDRRLSTLEDESKGEGKTINIQAVGNGWLYRSAVGKLRRLISVQELEILFKKEKIGSVHIKLMGGRYVIITFSSEDRRNEALKEKWLELWFDEINPWSGEAAKEERFVWIACYGMPLNAWNVPSFRAIGSIWGCFIEVDNDTLKETSYAKGKVLIATEKSNKIEGEVKLKVNGRIYSVRVEEEDTFRTVTSKGQVSNSEVEEEDDCVEDTDDDRDASSKKEENPMDDMENQRSKFLDDMAKNTEEEDVKSDNRDINGSHQYGLEEESDPVKPPAQEKTIGEGRNEESFNSIHGLESIVQDSQSPLIEECVESANHCSEFQTREAQQGNNQEQVKEKERVNEVGTNPVAWDSNVILRPSQVQGINLLVDLNPSAVRKNIRGQQFEASMSTEGEDIDSYIMDSQEQEQNAMDKELQNTIITGNNLGIKFNEAGVLRMKKMIEKEHKELIASLKNNTFAPLMRDQ